MVEAREFQVFGRVQGVGYRWHVMREAGRVGVTGWARNEGDGSVRVYAVGEAAALDRLHFALTQGPDLAWVERVMETPAALPAGGEPPERFIITV